MFKTHLLISVVLALISYNFFDINPVLFFLIVIAAGSFPDIDLPTSRIGSMIRPLSDIIHFLFGHRTITHSIFIPLAIMVLSIYFELIPYGIAFLIGYLGHIISDALSHEGINPLSPFFRFRIKGFIRVGGVMEYLIFLLLIFYLVIRLYRLI